MAAVLQAAARARLLRRAAIPLCLLALSLAVCLPWLSPWLEWDQPDSRIHLVRIYFMADALRRGDLFPRWLPDLYFGYGYPLFNFYAPLLYYVAGAVHLAGATVYLSLQWVTLAAVAAGTRGAYCLGRDLAGRRESGLLAASAYVLAPYPFLTNLYARGAVPEVLALGMLPWLLLSIWRAARDCGPGIRRRWLALITCLVAALVVTHNISALLAAGLCAVWTPVACWLPAAGAADNALNGMGRRARAVGWQTFGRIVLAGAAGVGLSAVFWLPAMWEIRHTQYDVLQEEGFRWDVRLFDPLRASGGVVQPLYPHSRVGPVDLSPVFDYSSPNLSAPEKPSLWQALLWLCAVAAAVVAAARGRRRPAVLAGFWSLAALVCWWLNTTWSRWAWEHLPLLYYTQYPWRLYGPLALCIAIAVAVALGALLRPAADGARALEARWASRPSIAGWLAAGAATFALALGSLSLRPALMGELPAHDIDARTHAAFEKDDWGAGTTTSAGEYLPRTVEIAPYESWRRRGIHVYEEAYPQASWQAGAVRLLEGAGAITGIGTGRNWVATRIVASEPVRLAVHQLWFPGWRAYVDGAEVPLNTAPYDAERQASYGFMVLSVPAGSHQVEVRFGPTPPRSLGLFVTCATVGLLGVWLWQGRRPGRASARSVAVSVVPPLLLGLAAVALEAWLAQPWPVRAGGSLPGERVVVDVAAGVEGRLVDVRAPGGRGQTWQPPFVEQRWLDVGGQKRRLLYMHPTSEVRLQLRVPRGAYFVSGLAMDPQMWNAPTGDGVRFVLEAVRAGQTQPQVLWTRDVNPRARTEDRDWLDQWVDLAPVVGQEVTLVMRTEPREDLTFDWAGWANPQVVVWDAARQSPAVPHRW